MTHFLRKLMFRMVGFGSSSVGIAFASVPLAGFCVYLAVLAALRQSNEVAHG